MTGAQGTQQRGSALAYPALLILGALDAAGYSILAPVLPTIAAETRSGLASMGLLVASFPTAMLAGFSRSAPTAGSGHVAAAGRPPTTSAPPSASRN